ncbi:MAG: PEP-CTERM sorting domain-containing protein [Verrucomicrobiota bacterium]
MKPSKPLLVVLTLVAASQSYANFRYGFSQSNYEVLPGEKVDVQVSLIQVEANPIDLAVDGIFSAGVQVVFGENAPSDPAVVLELSDISANPAFDDTLLGEEKSLTPGSSAYFIDSVDDIFAPLTGNEIFLGTFRFTVGNIVGEVTNLRAEDITPPPSTFTETVGGDINFSSLDEFISPGFSTITVIPEPTAYAALAGMFCAGLLLLRRRTR